MQSKLFCGFEKYAPTLCDLVRRNRDNYELNYIKNQILLLQTLSHIEPLQNYVTYDSFDKSAVDIRTSEVSAFTGSRSDIKAVTVLGGSKLHVWFGSGCRVNKLLITSQKDVGNIIIRPNTEIDNGVIQMGSGASTMVISSGSTLPNPNLLVDEENGYILVGDDCMFSTGVFARTNDGHAIYDKSSRKRINHGRPIIIHNHVWVGRSVSLGKGAVVGRDAIIGQGAYVGGTLAGSGVYVGQPAKMVRENTTWDRTQAETLDEAENIPSWRTRQTNHVRTCAQIDAMGKQDLGGIPVMHAISRILAATFESGIVNRFVESLRADDSDGATLCLEAHAARLAAVSRIEG
jgi:acetyltransferase-like isoleucine patch superfamily enzyme